jgi:hypothetical protein
VGFEGENEAASSCVESVWASSILGALFVMFEGAALFAAAFDGDSIAEFNDGLLSADLFAMPSIWVGATDIGAIGVAASVFTGALDAASTV